ncbi:MAG: uncharacterized protein JWN70_531 [Planctomycetaceae bacterium]|nr:uncharacterized protein [Planctomycetaceae bacterium]
MKIGVLGSGRWRLKLQLLTRHGVDDEEAFNPQDFSLIVTIAYPDKNADVYGEMAQIFRNRFLSQSLAVRAAGLPARVVPFVMRVSGSSVSERSWSAA